MFVCYSSLAKVIRNFQYYFYAKKIFISRFLRKKRGKRKKNVTENQTFQLEIIFSWNLILFKLNYMAFTSIIRSNLKNFIINLKFLTICIIREEGILAQCTWISTQRSLGSISSWQNLRFFSFEQLFYSSPSPVMESVVCYERTLSLRLAGH